jgi:TM2 domain-containing membrane protein YozV
MARLGDRRVARPCAAAQGERVTHPEFVAAYETGSIRVQINRDAAARFVTGKAMLPLVLLPFLGLGVALAIVGYVVAGIAVFLAAVGVRILVRRSADGFIVWRALRDAEFYQQVTAAGVLRVEP